MTIRLKVDGGLVAGYKNCLRRPGHPEMSFIVRGRYRLAPDTRVDLVRSEEIPQSLIDKTRLEDEEAAAQLDETSLSLGQGAMTGETMREEDEGRIGEALYPGDFVDFKPRADLLLRGRCFPAGADDTECEVAFSVGRWQKRLKVVGHRVWLDQTAGGEHTKPKPIGSIAVDYAHAYGGPGFANNPVGKGHVRNVDTAAGDDLYQPPRSERSMVMPSKQLPNVLYANGAEQRDGLPAGFGPLNSSWPFRRGKLGTRYDRNWVENRAPYFADDMDFSYFNAAPPDQQLETFLRGDETLSFTNLHPKKTQWSVNLPGTRVRVFIRDVDGASREIPMRLDTLFADLESEELFLTWRGITPVQEEDLTDVAFALVVTEPLESEPKAANCYLAELQAFADDPIGLNEAMPEGFMEFADRAQQLEKASDDELAALLEHPTGHSPPVAFFKNVFGPLAPAELDQADDAWNLAMASEHVDESDIKQKLLENVKLAIGGGERANDRGVDRDHTSGAVQAGSGARGTGPVIGAQVGMRLPVRDGESVVFPIGNLIREQEKKLLGMKEDKALEELSSEKRASIHAEFDAAIEKLRSNPELLEHDKHYKPFHPDDPPPDEPGPGADLQGHDLSDWDLSGKDLSGADLQCAILTRTNLSGANLAGAKLGGARLTRADLSGAKLEGVDLTSTSFDRVLACGADLSGVRLDMFRATGSNFTDSNFQKSDGQLGSFNECTLHGANFDSADYLMLSFDQCILEQTRFGTAKLEHVRFDRCTGRKLNLIGTTLEGTSFNECEMPETQATGAAGRGAIWFKSTIDRADFRRCNFVDSHFLLVNAQASSFERANLPGARFDRAILREASFERANLKGADMRKAVLSKTNFRQASLFDAQLTETAGIDVDFRDANMKGVNIQRAEMTKK